MTRDKYRSVTRIHSIAATATLIALVLLSNTGCGDATIAQAPKPENPPLVTGKALSFKAQSIQDVGSMPMNLAVTADGNFLVTTDIGNRQALWCIRTSDGQGISHVDFIKPPRDDRSRAEPITNGEAAPPQSDGRPAKTNGLYYGLAFSKNNVLYAAQGGHNAIAVLQLDENGTLKLHDHIPTKARDFPAGLALDVNNRLYVANNASGNGNPLTLSGSVAIYDPTQKKELGRYTFTASHGGTSNFPLGITVLRDGSKTYVASERDDCVYVLDTSDPAHPRLSATIATGAHPVGLLLSKDGKQLYVANSLSDTVSIVATQADKVSDTIMLRPAMVRDSPGVTPTGLALSTDEKTLYVALGDMNAVALIDLEKTEVRGYVPTGWYPSAVATSADGRRLYVANAKGASPRNP